ncbi:MAG: hypothetical protein ABJ349_10980, partial [Hyphomicrobiales bacterium]
MTAAGASAEPTFEILNFDDLDGWEEDDHSAALTTFRNTCMDLDEPDWRSLCAVAHDQKDAKAFFELFFRPILISDGQDALFTGYFEPELNGARYPSG